jgi:tetratricopeptide (TPR) repeat protein
VSNYRLFAAALMFIAFCSFAGEVEDLHALAGKQEYEKILKLTDQDDYPQKNTLRVMFARGVALAKLKRNSQAIDYFKGMTEKFPDQAEPYINLGVLYAGHGENYLARDALEKANKLSPKVLAAHENLAEVYLAMAKKEYSNAIKLGGNKEKLAWINNENTAEKINRHPDKKVLLENESLAKAVLLGDLEKWRKAWSDKNIDLYLSAYSQNMKPENGLSLSVWKKQRTNRLRTGGNIAVNIDSPVVSILNNKTAKVSFIQKYTSDYLSDVVKKTILFEFYNNKWLIVSEKQVGVL